MNSDTPETDGRFLVQPQIINKMECVHIDFARQLERQRNEYKIGHDRYEKLRRLSPMQFHELYDRNIKTGKPFDTLVDEL